MLMTMFYHRGQQFLDTKCDNQKSIQLNYVKGSGWPKHISESVSRCAGAPRTILNHTLIGEYKQRLMIICPYDKSQVETRNHILFRCKRFRFFFFI